MVFVADPASPVLDDVDAHHLTAVRRLRDGEPVVAADGAGRWALCRMRVASVSVSVSVDQGAPGARGARSGRQSAFLEPVGPVEVAVAPRPALTVAFAPVKGDRPEWVVQKLTELGVDRIVPILTVRSVVRWEGERGESSVERLRRVAREAAAQCRRAWLPEVTAVSSLPDLELLTGIVPALASPGGDPPDLARPVVAIGPEGGWDQTELRNGVTTVDLGPTILRSETAAVAAGTLLCALRYRLVTPLGGPPGSPSGTPPDSPPASAFA